MNNNEVKFAPAGENKVCQQEVPRNCNFDPQFNNGSHDENDDNRDHESKSTNLNDLKCDIHPQQKLIRY